MYKADVAGALPAALWAEILQRVPQQQRFTQCALVCKGWAGAAAFATVHVKQEFKAGAGAVPALAAFQSWLAQHAGQLLSLQLSVEDQLENFDTTYPLQLPLEKLTRLQRLELEGFEVQLPGEDGSSGSSLGAVGGDGSVAGSGQAAPSSLLSLQHLELFEVQLVSVDSLMQLTRAPQLKSLIVTSVDFADVRFSSDPVCYISNTEAGVQQVAAAIPRLLQQLPLLTVLKLPDIPFTDAAVQQAAAMQGLQHIAIQHVHGVPMCDVRNLPSSITELDLQGNMSDDDESPSLPPDLQQLSQLLSLKLTWCAVPPAVLGSVPQLQVLWLHECTLLPNGMDDPFQPEGTAALLEALPKLTRLEGLQLVMRGLDCTSINRWHFSALTSSSHLTQLFLAPHEPMPVPNGAVQHMFPAGRQLPVLQDMRISARLAAADEWCIDRDDIGRIISCCPGLQSLDIVSSVRPGADLSGLLQLPESCTSLLIGGAAFTD